MTKAQTVEHRYVPGKVAYSTPKRKDCEAEITWRLENGVFTMSAGIWQANKRDLYTCGQMVDKVAKYFPQDRKVQRMLAIWERWHLNDMKAGSAIQEQYLRDHPLDPAQYAYPKSHYDVVSQILTDAGLNPDSEGYMYGSAWKREELPADVVAEIEAWSEA